MNLIKKNLLIKMCITFLFVISLNSSAFARILANGSGDGYPPPGGSYRAVSIETYVEEGAGYFLNGNSNIQKFLELYELQNKNGINYEEWQTVLSNAMNNISSAVQTYEQLIKTAEATPEGVASSPRPCVGGFPWWLHYTTRPKLPQDVSRCRGVRAYIGHGATASGLKPLVQAHRSVAVGLLFSVSLWFAFAVSRAQPAAMGVSSSRLSSF